MEQTDYHQLEVYRNRQLEERETELKELKEELLSQREELTAAIEQLVLKNNHLEETLCQLQRRNEELDKILYRASHDLKTPVSSLEGLLELMAGEELSSELLNLHQYMDQKVSQMNDILKSLSLFAQASFDKIIIKEVVLGDVVKQALRDLAYLPNRQDVTIHVEYNNLNTVISDELILYSVLKSLISNSVIYRDPLMQGNVWVDFSSVEDKLCIEVADDGEGIDPQISGNIFDMFFRGSQRSVGPGLGLYIVKIATEKMKGNISWERVEGKTVFRIMLPLHGKIQ